MNSEESIRTTLSVFKRNTPGQASYKSQQLSRGGIGRRGREKTIPFLSRDMAICELQKNNEKVARI